MLLALFKLRRFASGLSVKARSSETVPKLHSEALTYGPRRLEAQIERWKNWQCKPSRAVDVLHTVHCSCEGLQSFRAGDIFLKSPTIWRSSMKSIAFLTRLCPLTNRFVAPTTYRCRIRLRGPYLFTVSQRGMGGECTQQLKVSIYNVNCQTHPQRSQHTQQIFQTTRRLRPRRPTQRHVRAKHSDHGSLFARH